MCPLPFHKSYMIIQAWQRAGGEFFCSFLHLPDSDSVRPRNACKGKHLYTCQSGWVLSRRADTLSWIQVGCVVWSTPGAVSQTLASIQSRGFLHSLLKKIQAFFTAFFFSFNLRSITLASPVKINMLFMETAQHRHAETDLYARMEKHSGEMT